MPRAMIWLPNHCEPGIVLNRVPAVGRINKNVYYCQGYSGHGVVATHVMGEIMSEAISGTMEKYDLFADIKHFRLPILPPHSKSIRTFSQRVATSSQQSPCRRKSSIRSIRWTWLFATSMSSWTTIVCPPTSGYSTAAPATTQGENRATSSPTFFRACSKFTRS